MPDYSVEQELVQGGSLTFLEPVSGPQVATCPVTRLIWSWRRSGLVWRTKRVVSLSKSGVNRLPFAIGELKGPR